MAILKIARMGHPILRGVADPVEDPTVPEVHRLIADMYETMLDAAGAGLAAPQVHVPKRLVIFRAPAEVDESQETDEEEETEGETTALTILVNPVIEPLDDAMAEDWEGCLSVPGLRGLVPRFTRIRYQGLAPDGSPIDRIAEDYHARVVQHECDHLDGILYPQRMTDLSKLIFDTEYRHFRAEALSEMARESEAAE